MRANIVFDGSFEGLLTVVYMRYYEKIEPLIVRDFESEASKQLTLGESAEPAPEITVKTDFAKAEKVYAALLKKTEEGAHNAYKAWLTPQKIYTEIFSYIVLCFKEGFQADDYKTSDYVHAVQKAARYVSREAHLLTGFCRFTQTTTGVYYCDISPVNNVLPMLAEHFCDRFTEQPFVIHDTRRGTAVIYDTKDCVIQEVGKTAKFEFGGAETEWQQLWSAFHKTIANESRLNKNLQRQMMPLRFRKHMTEFSAFCLTANSKALIMNRRGEFV